MDNSYIFVGFGSYHCLEDTKDFSLIFETFRDTPYTVVMAVHNMGLSNLSVL
ncbi:hypothetical protein OYT88_20155 [Sporolactobacillus sp. CQH2019]|uniref:hypothetical protein n=1 Tax=Sporolactobacillus sp. CQH2019 TaxID=3023512 RepID=UPI0023676091|nr:hypothetical protein [Sporolactobacillus sp. CQH2019]MDD9150836.1 hypothetical protein [Sporolactobacillus sp. CQH2019]